ncbi:metal-dependent hydrolase [soil metagenome]
MEPITHLMTGACLARAGFNRKAAYAAVAMTVAAELPDIDTLWGVAGPVASFQHHRGWTHTLLGMPFEAAAVVGVCWGWHRWRTRRKGTTGDPESQLQKAAPVRWGLLFGFVLVALLSHLLLDWTNNYGVRPFFPFNPRWYEGSIVFIFEPVLFGMLLVALVAPALFGLIGSEVGAGRARFRGRGWAIAALLGMVSLWGWRWVEKDKALQLVAAEEFRSTGATAADSVQVPVVRVGVSPNPITPYKWHVIVETPMDYRLAVADTLSGTVTTTPGDVFYKPPTTIATLVAKRSWLGEVYLDWARFPLVTEQTKSDDPDEAGLTTVTFRDLRFMYDVPLMAGRTKAPLSGAVTINEDRKVVRMEMDGRVQR